MTEQINNSSMRSAFIKKKEEQSDKVLIEAQRLVNLYRNINAFPEEFHTELDQTLLHTSSEVQSTLTRIVGGEEVRRYLDFLKENKVHSDLSIDTEEDNAPHPVIGYLPEPEDDINLSFVNEVPLTQSSTSIDMEKVIKNLTDSRQSELEKLLKAQTETLTQLLKQMGQNRQELAGHQTDRLINALHQDTQKRDKYSDIIETTPVLVPDETEGF